MKKMLYLAPVFALILMLSSCSAKTPKIEDYEWKMRTMMSDDADGYVLAVGEPDSVYPEAKVVDMTLKAKNGKLTVTSSAVDTVYNGTYTAMRTTPDGTDYEMIIDGEKVYATVAPTEYYDGSQTPTLVMTIDDFAVYFEPTGE